jgi:hypothetical protein
MTDNLHQPEVQASRQGDPVVTPPPAPDPFDPESLRLGQEFETAVGVRKTLITVPVRKPDKSWFVQVHPAESYCLKTAVIELKEDREIYLIAHSLWPELAGESTFGARALFTTITRQGVVFFWPIRLPGHDGKLDAWSESALEAASMAEGKWVRVCANMHLGAYEIFEAAGTLPPPVWPERPLGELLEIAFKDRFIDSLDHPVLRRLRGEA